MFTMPYRNYSPEMRSLAETLIQQDSRTLIGDDLNVRLGGILAVAS